MALQFCKYCNKSVYDHDAVQKNGAFMCPTCDKQLVYFGKEWVKVSPRSRHAAVQSETRVPQPVEPIAIRKFKTDPLHLALKARVDANPHDKTAVYDLAQYYSANQASDAAIDLYQTLTQYDPEDARAYKQLASLYASKKAYLAALSCLKTLAKLAPKDPLVLYNLAVAYLNCQDKGNARNASRMARALAQSDAQHRLLDALDTQL